MKSRKMKKVLARWQLYLLMLPALLYVILFRYKPMYGVILAFKDYKMKAGIWGSEWVGFENFQRLFASYTFPIALRNTLTLSALNLLIGFPLPIILALAVNEIRNNKRKKLLQTIFYAPHFISMVVMCGMVIMFLSTSGIVNVMIQSLGGEKISFMQESELFKWIYSLSGMWQNAGWGTIIYMSALSAVDKSVLEAAEIDGASRFQRVIYVNIPTIVPTITITLILNCGQLLSLGYEKILLLQNSANLTASEVISTYVYKVGLESYDFSFSTAASLFDSICNIIILLTVNKIANKVSNSGLW